ncbi:cyclodeaminase/cyclohydrolase family protein [Crassaminicella profunda]|uniref:cyclodeaminase/cyclohydrolase family protein n=1 Tax=Crassaminicella profunda TaxID=1286698 RepID=UPI001CA6EE00|nr:cyclodeaminase/cyclohydrolase family protein [Crassaminicella profunda]QZY54751.1 cyclodeaminase/cyclohydrolase family protein [Crassaminicella profunda]
MSGVNMLEKVIDSNNFTVGGGVASALAGAMGAGMISMVAKLSTKKDYGLTVGRYNEIAKETDQLAKDLLMGSQQDEKAFCKIKDAYALPKSTEEEKKRRSAAIQDGGVSAATVPKDNGFMCKRVYQLGMFLKDKSNPNAASDLAEAIMLAEAGVKGCILNIEANLSLIKEQEKKSQFQKCIDELRNF